MFVPVFFVSGQMGQFEFVFGDIGGGGGICGVGVLTEEKRAENAGKTRARTGQTFERESVVGVYVMLAECG
ncbi:hypothetical protein BpHYR1_027010 [Brachionus plicatilis]|uniref:Uncharacterized protein n=1 Tax=Brachionus plicatilis TaxID=10195 RepID=A0A3M7SPK3_BRAPC|nr:hypothetical protein BpHYR1_027010 [Brachionus plicatilis]